MRRFSTCLLAAGVALAAGACQRSDASAAPSDAPIYTAARIIFPTSQPLDLPDGLGGGEALKSLLNVPGPMRYGEFVWHEEGVPEAKPWVLVDLSKQTMSVFRGEHEIGAAVTLYGVDHKPTPLGRFKVLAMLKDHQSSIYDAEMPFTLRLTGDGIAIHGADAVAPGIGTHGCLGIPLEFARKLFEEVEVGTEVLIIRGRPREASHSLAALGS